MCIAHPSLKLGFEWTDCRCTYTWMEPICICGFVYNSMFINCFWCFILGNWCIWLIIIQFWCILRTTFKTGYDGFILSPNSFAIFIVRCSPCKLIFLYYHLMWPIYPYSSNCQYIDLDLLHKSAYIFSNLDWAFLFKLSVLFFTQLLFSFVSSSLYVFFQYIYIYIYI